MEVTELEQVSGVLERGIGDETKGDHESQQGEYEKVEKNKTKPTEEEAEDKSTVTTFKTLRDLIEDLKLDHAEYHHSPSATDEERDQERQRVLDDPNTHHGFLFPRWSCDPTGQEWIALEEWVPRSVAPNKIQLCGPSPLEYFKRAPDLEGFIATTSSRKMLRNATGEDAYERAKDVVEQSERKRHSELIQPCDIARLIKDGEAILRELALRMRREKQSEENEPASASLFPSTYPIKSVFEADTYPEGWIREPLFESRLLAILNAPRLQKYIPQHLLPERLVVHDPCNVLSGCRPRYRKEADVTHVYKLSPSTKYSERRDADKDTIAEDDAKERSIIDNFLADPHSRNTLPNGILIAGLDEDSEPGPVKPPIYMVLPQQPRRGPVKEGHLFLDSTIGQGNHSFVYTANFELPRNLLVEQDLCKKCVNEDIYEQLQAIRNPDGSAIEPRFNEKSGKLVCKDEFWMEVKDEQHLFEKEWRVSFVVYTGPYQALRSRVRHHNPEEGSYCKHLEGEADHPLTTRVKVAAKLSIQNDSHLAKEALNYQRFPRYFFEHWSGRKVVPPILEPVRAYPIVPQFYGYYVFDENAEPGTMLAHLKPYLSPILLLEDCGKDIAPNQLSADDRETCASLVYRFHEADWFHGSIAKRNIIAQRGPLSSWPQDRTVDSCPGGKQSHSFRLIDFGRSCHAGDVSEKEMQVGRRSDEKKIERWLNGSSDLE